MGWRIPRCEANFHRKKKVAEAHHAAATCVVDSHDSHTHGPMHYNRKISEGSTGVLYKSKETKDEGLSKFQLLEPLEPRVTTRIDCAKTAVEGRQREAVTQESLHGEASYSQRHARSREAKKQRGKRRRLLPLD